MWGHIHHFATVEFCVNHVAPLRGFIDIILFIWQLQKSFMAIMVAPLSAVEFQVNYVAPLQSFGTIMLLQNSNSKLPVIWHAIVALILNNSNILYVHYCFKNHLDRKFNIQKPILYCTYVWVKTITVAIFPGCIPCTGGSSGSRETERSENTKMFEFSAIIA